MKASTRKILIHFIVYFDKLKGIIQLWILSAFTWISSGFGIRVILRDSLTDFKSDQDTLTLPKHEIKKLNAILLLRGILHNNSLMQTQAVKILNSLTKKIKASNKPLDSIPLPEWRFGFDSEEELYENFIKPHRPVKILGFDYSAKEWDLQYFIDNFGHEEIIFTDEQGVNFVAPLKRLERVKDGTERLYVHNCARILHKEDLDINLNLDKLSKLIRWQNRNTYQLFLGAYKSSGSPLHCAPSSNAFLQIEGSKLWTFVDPAYTHMLYPVFTSQNQFQGSSLPHPIKPSDINNYPLYFYCHRYQTILKPGEILLVPRWWHHSVENLTKKSVGIATRWEREKHVMHMDTNHLYSLLLNTPRFICYRTEIAFRRNKMAERRLPKIEKFLNNVIYDNISHDESHAHRDNSSMAAWRINNQK